MSKTIKVLCVGAGHMGTSHARAYHAIEGFEICGIVTRSEGSRKALNADLGAAYPEFGDYFEALEATKPDAVSISTYPDTHAEFAKAAMDAGADVFIEKPLAETVAEAEEIVAKARETGRKLVIGYILRHHPSWIKFIEVSHTLGKPLVMRMNLNQQSSGANWETHKNLMSSISPIVDCGVHYVDVMCQITDANPVEVRGMGLRLSDQVDKNMYNYGHFQILFDDGSLGWYEAGWGPMMSETAYFVKDVVSPNGSVSIIVDGNAKSDDMDTHTKTSLLRVHSATIDYAGVFTTPDKDISMEDEPGHDELCAREQAYLHKAISENVNLDRHMRDAVQSLKICIAADESVRSGNAIKLRV